MPVAWDFHRAGFAVLTLLEPYSFRDWRKAMDQILVAQPRAQRFLVDRRGAGIPTADLIDEIIGYFRAKADRLAGSVAAIVVGSEAAYGMARLLEIRTGLTGVRMPIKIFLEYEDAVCWLHEHRAEAESDDD